MKRIKEAGRLRDLTVLKNDHGIRPAGAPNACFYCHSKVGQQHGYTCAVVVKEIELIATFEGYDKAATFAVTVPFFWKEEDINYHFNESGWCADNILGYENEDIGVAASARKKLVKKGHCLCGVTTVMYGKTIDRGPYIEARDPHDDEEEAHDD